MTGPAVPAARWRTPAFGLAITLGACLLFQIQFLLGKLILPWFGGASSVWATALVAYQALLLAGYAYAHALASLPSRRHQVTRHAFLFGVVLVVLAWRALTWPSPVTPGDAWKPDPDGSPAGQILLLLVGAVGLPFVLLASTSPLLQRWYADLVALESTDAGRTAGTAVPTDTSESTDAERTAGTAVPTDTSESTDAGRTTGTAVPTEGFGHHGRDGSPSRPPQCRPRAERTAGTAVPTDTSESTDAERTVGTAVPTEPRSPYRLYALSNLGSLLGLLSYPLLIEPRLDVFSQGLWWAGAYGLFAAVTLFCAWQMRAVPISAGVAREIVAQAPTMKDHLLWVLLAAVPSALLQATTTKITQDIAAVPFLWMVPLALYLLTFVLAFEYPRFYHRHLFTLAVALCTVAAIPEWSTRVTLAVTLGMLTLGGLALHGELASRAPAPAWLTRYFLLVSTGGVIGSALVALGAPVVFDGIVEYPLTLMAAVLVLALVYLLEAPTLEAGERRGSVFVALTLVLLGLVIAAKTAVAWRDLTVDAVFTSRSFFGAIRVREQQFADTGERYRRLQHGTTLHGMQYLEGDKARQPVSYYTPPSGIGQAMGTLSALERPARIGVVGLGTGTMAAYGRKGDALVFFEIDPQIVAMSTAPTPLFRYLRDSEAEVTIVGGDARLSLERAAAPYRFDVLALDAFSSDAVPVHLLTREAFALYARHLRDARSLLAVHVSNRYLDLEGIVQAGGEAAGFTTVQVEHDVVDNDTERTTWMILARDSDALVPFGTPYVGTGAAPWTDASSNLLGVLRRE